MSKGINKYLYLWVLQGYYAPSYGWEDLSDYEDYRQARVDLREYRLAEPYARHRIIKQREPNPDCQRKGGI